MDEKPMDTTVSIIKGMGKNKCKRRCRRYDNRMGRFTLDGHGPQAFHEGGHRLWRRAYVMISLLEVVIGAADKVLILPVPRDSESRVDNCVLNRCEVFFA